ncbi:MAG: SBBP repeat-containing protein [Bacteriovoracaceae bacterium]|nr:SBBP repeat-containing protein [Bacteriovoracaceae bacterium]
MRTLFLGLKFLFIIFLVSCNSKRVNVLVTSPWVGTKQLGVAGSYTAGYGITSDRAGSIYVTGYTDGGLDGNTLTGNLDFFVTKYDVSGLKQWTRQLGVASVDTLGNGVTSDSANNVYVAGYTDGGLDGNTLIGTRDFVVTKYSTEGVKQWTRQLGVTGAQTLGNAITSDSLDNIYVAGYTSGALDGQTLTGTVDFFVTKYNSAGVKQWTRLLGVASATTFGNGITSDSLDNIYVAGYTTGGLDGNSLTGGADFFVTKYNSAGVKQWTRQLGGTILTVVGQDITSDTADNVYVAGYTSGALDGQTFMGTTDFFVTKYNSAGVKQWTRQLGVTSFQTYGAGITSDSLNNVYITGDTGGGLDGNTLTGDSDFFVTKYDSAGVKQWTRQLGIGAGAEAEGYAITSDLNNNVFVTGYTDGGVDGNTLTGLSDFFITKYNIDGFKQ